MASELVRFNTTTKKFEVASDAVRLLRSLSGPICVVAVCGRARQGKSFLLNQLLAKLSGSQQQKQQGPAAGAAAAPARFAVGSTVKPCTKGLWLWSRPVPRTLPDGHTCHLLLMDAEGIDSYDQTADYSNHIFSLALLLSSVLIYNQMGSIDESSVENLASVCEFARLIWGRAAAGSGRPGPSSAAGGGDSGAGNDVWRGGGCGSRSVPASDDAACSAAAGSADLLARELSPALVWLLRDFQLQLTEDGRQISPRDYMEQVLRELSPGGSEAVRAKNQLRASIKARFPDRDCHALVRPLNDEARLAQMDSVPASELRLEFRKGLDSLAALLLGRCRPKTLRGSPLTGPVLAGLAEAYCGVINSGGVPAISSTWQSVVQSECQRALDGAVDLFRARLEAARGREVGLEALDAAHGAALEAALRAFSEQAVGDRAEREPYVRRLHDAAAAAVGPLRAAKRAEAEARAVELLSAAARRFTVAIRGQGSDLAAAEAQLHSFLREYGTELGLGPDKYMRAAEFLAGTVVPELRRVAQEARASATGAAARVSELETEVSELARESAALRGSLVAASLSESRLQRELAVARASEAAAAAEAAASRAATVAADREAVVAREQLAAARVELATRSEAADAGTARLRSELAAAQQQRAVAEASASAAAAARAAAAQQLATREAELAARAAEVEAARRAAVAQSQDRAESLSAQLAARNATLANLQRERDLLQASLEQYHRAAATGGGAAVRQADGETGGGSRAAAAGLGAERRAATPTAGTPRGRRKRDRVAADLSSGDEGDVDLVMVDAGPAGFITAGGGTATAAAAADAAAEDGGACDDDDGVEMTPAATAAWADTPTRARRTVRRKRASAVPDAGQRRRATATTTPAATATTATVAGGGGVTADDVTLKDSPFTVERKIEMRASPRKSPAEAAGGRGTPAAAAATTATTPTAAAAAPAAVGSRPLLPPNLDSMKVDELKDWLTLHGWEGEVFDRARSRTTRKEWAELVRAKCGPATRAQTAAAAGDGGGGGGEGGGWRAETRR